MIFPHLCLQCGATTEPLLIQVAQVINVCCFECQAHIKYCNTNDLPKLEDIKAATWQAAASDLRLIEAAKKGIEFTPSQYNDFAQVKYWRLYQATFFVRKITKYFERITPRITFV